MQPHEERVVAEARELGDKIEKLYAFMRGSVFGAMPLVDRALLWDQSEHMVEYSSVLQRRIARFPAL